MASVPEALRFDALIVGGGPAGQAAAMRLAGSGCHVAVADEQQRPGGQILRQPFRGSARADARRSGVDAELLAQLSEFESARVDWLGAHSVLGVESDGDGWAVTLSDGTRARNAHATTVLVATGCRELAVPLPGWTLPGVLTAGAVQTLLKGQRMLPGDRIAFVGTHPLQLLAASEALAAGATVAAVVFPQAFQTLASALARHAASTTRHARYVYPGVKALADLRRAGVSIRFGIGPHAVLGRAQVEALELADGTQVPCDTVALCYGFVPQSDLVRQAGARVAPTGLPGAWSAVVDAWQRTTMPGLYAAGETTGVAGAYRALATGAVAGVGMSLALGRTSHSAAEAAVARLRPRVRHLEQFGAALDAIADPKPHWPALTADTVICRCEGVTAATLQDALPRVGSANALKLLTRCGMGRCQGRICETTVARLMQAHAKDGDGGFTSRFPSRPASIGSLLDLPGELHE